MSMHFTVRLSENHQYFLALHRMYFELFFSALALLDEFRDKSLHL